jgi:hypothetical protein
MSPKDCPVAWLIVLSLTCAFPDMGAAEPMNWPCQGRCIDAAWISNKGWAYFFKGGQFWRYDIPLNKADLGDDAITFPRQMRLWPGLPQAWSSGIDTALNGGDGKVYWFKGREYVRFDIADQKVDAGPLPIARQWPGLPSGWSGGFNAALNWDNGKVTFFKGREALTYDLEGDKASDPGPIADTLHGIPEAWSSGIDTAVNWGDGKVYVFKGPEYVRYDMASNKVEGGYPRPIATNWPGLMPLVDWMNWSAKLPDRAISVGREADNRTIFLCAAVDGKAIYPGKTWSANNFCNYSDGQREVQTNVYAVATTTLSIAWVAKTSAPLDRLIPVGISPAGRTYYLCRARFENGVHSGRIEASSGECTITYAGRSHTLNDEVEIAAVPTAVNSPNIPHIVRMLSPAPNSEKFKAVCGSEITFTVRDPALGARYPSYLPDMKTLFQIAARNSCAMLYKSPSEVPKYAKKVQLVVEDNRGNRADAFADHSDTQSTVTFNAAVFPATGPNVMTLVRLFYHEGTHTTQWDFHRSGFKFTFNEGIADYVLFTMWERRSGTPGGNWMDGYDITAYFLRWIERRQPDFVYKLNMSAAGNKGWTPDVFRTLTGRSVDALWEEYLRDASPATLTQPESLLKWSRARMPENMRRRACEVTVYWDDDFKGDSFRTTQDQLHLKGGWNDQISSIVITSGEWEFFEHDEFGGRVLKLNPGRYLRLGDRGWNDQISSFRCLDGRLAQYGQAVIGCEIAVYWHDDFQGDVLRTTHDLQRLTGGWNDQISSIVVASGIWEFFEHDEFGGQVLKLSPGRYPRLGDRGWNDRISSFRCIEPRPIRQSAR